MTQIDALLERAHSLNITDLLPRIIYFSEQFLGKPYQLDALGDGGDYRFDAFDCLTYVNTVMALAYADNSNEFQSYLIQLNYYDADPDYLKRFHFMSLDWNPQNQRAGFIRDITRDIVDEHRQPCFVSATTVIDKAAWFRKKNVGDFSDRFKPESITIDYIPLTLFFNDHQEPNHVLFDQISRVCIVEIVRPCWDLREQIGTHLHVSHLGFVIQTDAGFMYRQASSLAGGVVDIPMETYLRDQMKIPTIKGINVQTLENKPRPTHTLF